MTETEGTRMSESLFTLENVNFSYSSGLEVLKSVNLVVKPGEIVAVTGPSGCGKSTLLHIIAQLVKPTGGTFSWHNEQSDRSKLPSRRRLSLVFQRDTVFPWRTVEENIAFGLDYIDITAAERKERIEWLLQLGRLEEFRSVWPKQLSGGMRRRVALLMGVAPLPEVLLLDEPFSALDEPTRVGVHADLLDIVYKLNLTVVLVTHDIAEAVSLADRILLLSRRPSQFVWSLNTELGRPRDLLSLRQTQRYADLYASTWKELWQVDSPTSTPMRMPQEFARS
jgi:NitT/TauT family transport system ATP-binding protein